MFGSFSSPSHGYHPLAERAGRHSGMLMDAGYLSLGPGQAHQVGHEEDETALLLLAGEVEFQWQGRSVLARRPDSFDHEPWCLHLPRGLEATVRARAESELFLMATENPRDFPARLFTPEDCTCVEAGREALDGCAWRGIRTVFDHDNAPHSNLVLGEVMSHAGRWSSYPPHHHPQPELYFFRFDRPQGFGACFVGDQVHRTTHLSYAAIPGGLVHPQVTAPGYRMQYVWAIRHLEGRPWRKDRHTVPEHEWLEPGAAAPRP